MEFAGAAALGGYGYAKYRKWKRPRNFAPSYPQNIQSEIKRLKRQVGHNKSELIHHRINGGTFLSNTTGIGNNGTINLSTTFVATSDYRDNILGDTFRNKKLILSMSVPPVFTDFRVVVYRPKKVGQTLSFTSNETFNGIPDPKSWKIFLDTKWNPDKVTTGQHKTWIMNLGDMLTEYNSTNSVLEAGEIKILMIHNGAAVNYFYSLDHVVQNK